MSGQPGVQTSSSRGLLAAPAGRYSLRLLFLGATFFLARGAFLAELFPFGPAAVVVVAYRQPRLLWPAVFAAMAGMWLGAPFPVPAYERLLLLFLLGLIFSVYPGLRRGGILTPATMAPVAVILVRGLYLTFGQPSFYAWVQLIFEAILAWGLSLAFLEATVTTRLEERLLGGGLFLVGLLLGLKGSVVAGFALQNLLGSYILLLAALAGGPGAGAAVGAAVGFLPSLAQLVTPALAGLLAFTGLLAGALQSLGKPGVIGGYLLAHLMLAGYFLGPESLTAAIKEGAIVALALAATPPYLVRSLQQFLTTTATPAAAPAAVVLGGELKAALKTMARSLKFTAFTESPLETVRQVARATCRGCPAGKVCWELEGEQMVTLLEELLQKGSHAPLSSTDIPEWLASRCGRVRELLAALTGVAGRSESRPADNSLGSGLAAILENVALLLDSPGAGAGASDRGGQQPPPWKVSVGIAAIPRHHAEVSGDAYLAMSLTSGQFLLALGDGMGAGRQAAETSNTALELLRDMLAAGFPPAVALQTTNLILLLRSPRESFTTLDMALIDCHSATARLYKLGACPTFIRRDGSIRSCSSRSLPAGILEDLQVESLQEELQEGDLLVMVSDGVLEAHRDVNEKERWLLGALHRAGAARPQEIADRLLKQARALVEGRPRDDMTVVVARLERNPVV